MSPLVICTEQLDIPLRVSFLHGQSITCRRKIEANSTLPLPFPLPPPPFSFPPPCSVPPSYPPQSTHHPSHLPLDPQAPALLICSSSRSPGWLTSGAAPGSRPITPSLRPAALKFFLSESSASASGSGRHPSSTLNSQPQTGSMSSQPACMSTGPETVCAGRGGDGSWDIRDRASATPAGAGDGGRLSFCDERAVCTLPAACHCSVLRGKAGTLEGREVEEGDTRRERHCDRQPGRWDGSEQTRAKGELRSGEGGEGCQAEDEGVGTGGIVLERGKGGERGRGGPHK
eukprot:3359265-Rhodomonas_salina.1